MCIIAAKPAGVKMPAEDYMDNMFSRNPDGAGIMWADGGKVHIEKGFMNKVAFNTWLTEFGKTHNLTALPIVMHFRITTHGGTKPENCHPFPITDSEGMLRKLKVTTDVGVAHNGVIDITCKKGMSDTMTYIASQMAPLKRAVPKFYKNKDLLQMIENAIDSKMAILDAKGGITLIGDFVEEAGIKYSNNSYKDSGFFRSFNWSCWDRYDNPDKWEMGCGMYDLRHQIVMWLDPDNGEYALDMDGNEYQEAAIDQSGDVYYYDDVEGALRYMPGGQAWNYDGDPVKFDPQGFVMDELIIEQY